MKYLKTLNLWDKTTQQAIQSGQIKVQRGQWMICGTTGKKCRYVSHTKRTIHVIHWQGTAKRTAAKFKMAVAGINYDKVTAGITLTTIKRLLGSLKTNDLGYPLAMSEGEGFLPEIRGKVMAVINKYSRNAININGLITQLKIISKGPSLC